MKRSMWKVDPSGEFQFSDFTDASKQIPLFNPEPDYQWLREIITYEFERTEIAIEVLIGVGCHRDSLLEHAHEKASLGSDGEGRRSQLWSDRNPDADRALTLMGLFSNSARSPTVRQGTRQLASGHKSDRPVRARSSICAHRPIA